MEANIFNTANVINLFVALGTCAAVLVALHTKKQSSFESTFSLLLAQHNQALKDLKYSNGYIDRTKKILIEFYSLDKANKVMHRYDDFFGSYFRILYHLLKFIDRDAGYHAFDIGAKKQYTSLVRSQLDNTLTYLLAVNCSHASPDNQYDNFKKLIERYSMLEHLILDKDVLLKHAHENIKLLPLGITSDIKHLDEQKKTIFHEMVKSYSKAAFGTNPGLKKYL